MESKRLWLNRDPDMYAKWAELLEKADLVADDQLDFSVGFFDGEKLIATGSIFQNILKCIAIDPNYQNENLLTQVVQKLREQLQEIGYTHCFLYTKPNVKHLFQSLGFSEIIATEELAFMEQGFPDFNDYLNEIKHLKRSTHKNAGIVMNANPFTNGHLYLITEAAKKNETVYVFVVSEDRSLFDTATRFRLVVEGVNALKNVVVLPTRDYIVSNATFPSYFLKDQAKVSVAKVQAKFDAELFKNKIAPVLEITTRFVGEEPFSQVTEIYNQEMKEVFSSEMNLVILPRKRVADEVISASRVRTLLKQNNEETLKKLVPETTFKELMKYKKQ